MTNVIYGFGRKMMLNGIEYDVFADMKIIPFYEVSVLIWKSLDVVGCPNYEINQHGQVRNILTNRLINPFKESSEDNTYSKYTLSHNKKKYVFKAHRLVVLAFELGTEEQLEGLRRGELEIDHIDGCRSHNSIDNLRIVSRGENVRNRHTVKKEVRRWDEETVKKVFVLFHQEKMSKSAISRMTGMDRTTVRGICNRKTHAKTTEELLYLVA